jgi:DNA-binding NtrC family response regulator
MESYKAHILVLDDDQSISSAIHDLLTSEDYRVSSFQSASDGLIALANPDFNVDLVISDINLPGMNGLEFVAEVKKRTPEMPIILMSAFGRFETAVQAIRLGAFDFISKPFDVNEMLLCVERALTYFKLVRDNQVLTDEVSRKWSSGSIIGKSQKIQIVFDLISRVSKNNANVLITGESGTGKELVARSIHDSGPRADKPFIAVNCSAIPEALLESELFGHSKGSFTGAVQSRKGLFQEADTGTIFLDEIGDMSLPLQAKLLRVLQDKLVRPVGDNTYKQVDVRIIAATNRDLPAAIKAEKFREDLFYRLCVIPIPLPPLRERQEDIILLAQHYIRKFASLHNSNVKKFSKEALAYLVQQPWPGNVRELENFIERVVIMSPGPEIREQDVRTKDVKQTGEFQITGSDELLPLHEIEKRYITYVLSKTGGKKEKTAHILQIDRKTLYRKISEFNLKPIDANVSSDSTHLEIPRHDKVVGEETYLPV